ncbi:glycosidase [Lacrimispora saccharolytica]|uniref:Sucrose phosphorylase n=1 Tax=Lacrimispora saccharolytica (strain ATCC 35040 / DSM 2544 / NRCC 2533 / WM1) TaxID=610130 RepID=D9R4N3_LACSW|nr:glycosidase [Lacrimispora saccharolytica]ADL03217.1 Sucrose phosphorylase [[Clostridium] saccharolyticum WM1]QRV18604.1 glycosidase [Lacrimispora saccharolytica]
MNSKEDKFSVDYGVMLNAYPDSMGGTLSQITDFLKRPELAEVFRSFYILPSIFNTDLDRGFSVIDYGLNERMADRKDLEAFKDLGIDLKLDFILNHSSVLSKEFQDILKNGEKSRYRDFFIDWNKFWEGYGTMTEEGYIQPDEALIKDMFFRKPGLPILMVRLPDGKNVPYWNTFYQEVQYKRLDQWDLMQAAEIQYAAAEDLARIVNQELQEGKKPSEIEFESYEKYRDCVVELLESGRRYLGQMDLNIRSPLVWEYYDNTLKTLSEYGAKIVRLDAFAYAPKAPGERNFLNDPGTWDLLQKVQDLADQYHLQLLPEIHSGYGEKTYELLAGKGYMTYDFFLPGLIIHALESGSGEYLTGWAKELKVKKIKVVNMLGCHDGIPLLDLKGLIPDEEIEGLIKTIVGRGGFVKNLHGQKNVYYQVNATYYSALGEDDKKMLLSRALQLFMPGKPQVWYLDLFAGKNDYEAVKKAGAAGHKEVNRTNLSLVQIEEKMGLDVVKKQIEMLRFRNNFPAFGFDSDMDIQAVGSEIDITWKKEGYEARLKADLKTCEYEITGYGQNGFVYPL